MANESKPAFLNQPGVPGGGGGSSYTGNPFGGDTKQGPVQDGDYLQGGAPAGRVFGGDLPVQATSSGGSAFSEGFQPSSENGTMPEPGSSTGFPVARR